jgi:hypothetical protein
LLGGQHFHEAVAEAGKVERSGDVAIERGGVELGQDVDLENFGIDAVTDGNIDQAVLASQGDGGFGPLFRQRIQTGSSPSTQNNG